MMMGDDDDDDEDEDDHDEAQGSEFHSSVSRPFHAWAMAEAVPDDAGRPPWPHDEAIALVPSRLCQHDLQQ